MSLEINLWRNMAFHPESLDDILGCLHLECFELVEMVGVELTAVRSVCRLINTSCAYFACSFPEVDADFLLAFLSLNLTSISWSCSSN